eukprot:CAMPEP_0173158204 /NCGR_PEP_ID=MMETSP1105-20130129/16175_1 /TAXON_ID=2985 /ORGANISM="Ochromonas sp., Strain BG-1" /LENGTH=46 /DNA_ID= /DNA_START= /DNA_END= /DNA_ORIENTATION=
MAKVKGGNGKLQMKMKPYVQFARRLEEFLFVALMRNAQPISIWIVL